MGAAYCVKERLIKNINGASVKLVAGNTYDLIPLECGQRFNVLGDFVLDDRPWSGSIIISAKEKERSLVAKATFKKLCPHCRKIFFTDVRHQKFCSTEDQIAYNKNQAELKKRYKDIQPVELLRVAAHTLAVKVIDVQVKLGLLEYVCSHPDCNKTEELQVHHKDLNWLNASPANLCLFCTNHHSGEHSKIEKELKDSGNTVYDLYPADFLPLAEIINKIEV